MIGINLNGEYVTFPDPRYFTPETQRRFACEAGEAICHRFSYNGIEKALCFNMTHFDKNTLQALFSAVTDDNPPDAGNINEAMDLLMDTDWSNVIILNNILNILNNCQFNLKKGDASWNSSVGNAFDPYEWFYQENERIYSKYDETKRPPVPLLPHDGFYLTNENDGRLLHKLLNGVPTYPQDSIGIFMAVRTEDEYNFIYSSSNKIPFINESASERLSASVFYLFNGEWFAFN